MLRPAPLALFLLLAGPAGAATVLSVGDGVTLRVVDAGKRLTIRMACIDAPETAQRPYGAASRQRLQELAPVGSVVTLRPRQSTSTAAPWPRCSGVARTPTWRW